MWLFLCWGTFPLYPLWWEIFIINGCLNFVKGFFCIYLDDFYSLFCQWRLSCWLICRCWTIFAFHLINPTWSWRIILSTNCWIQFANISLRISLPTFSFSRWFPVILFCFNSRLTPESHKTLSWKWRRWAVTEQNRKTSQTTANIPYPINSLSFVGEE